jgi:fatty acid desaturase
VQPRVSRVEWPTVVVAGAIYSGWLVVLAVHHRLPLVVLLACLGVVGAWHGSLQHEVIHGHPTPWERVNTAFAVAPLSLWLPFGAYRTSHLRHHESLLTDPDDDPESFYVSPDRWTGAGAIRHAYWGAMRTLVGRLVLGPVVRPVAFWAGQLRACARNVALLVQTVRHLLAAGLVLVVVVRVAGVPLWHYVLGVVVVGGALSLLRSFVEHRAADDSALASAIVRSGRFFGLLYLNNNLHLTHHAMPAAPWYVLPRLTTTLGAEDLAARGAGLYRGYAEVWRRFAVHPFSSPVHPLAARSNHRIP